MNTMQIPVESLEQATQDAFNKAQALVNNNDSRRWQNAISRARRELITSPNPYMDWTGEELLILSPESNEIYAANGTCQCKAYTTAKYPCWHRAASRIVQRALGQ